MDKTRQIENIENMEKIEKMDKNNICTKTESLDNVGQNWTI